MLNNIYLGNKRDICALLISGKWNADDTDKADEHGFFVLTIAFTIVIPCRDTGSPNYGASEGFA